MSGLDDYILGYRKKRSRREAFLRGEEVLPGGVTRLRPQVPDQPRPSAPIKRTGSGGRPR